ncbi:MAG: DUF3316 domain-containing protein [Muribaculaceae bacterium]|nr:DUF3316 domain-containing protein [Muribaculaceae bacterium]MDE5845059.1 DUF3316 domain-containing protein [Muribaculaceae bacterium]MDE5858039.1 DUF3316 domain-containing protein [Muribaculaceae bacterium]MDE7155099.1 DUF3316 domain-containing protein [Muribaculaceae bacterium]MDE7368608.1 DUF3316 domain-containing protein [Muribaculaceae bacterium]
MKRLISLIAAMLVMTISSESISGQEVLRPVMNSYTLEVGTSHITDTYLSPLKYKGQTVAFGYDRMQAMKFNPERWVMGLRIELGVDKTQNPAKNTTIWGAGVAARWGMMYKLPLSQCPVKFALGGSTGINLGALYTTRNGNNPVAAKASWTVNLTGMATWTTRLGRLPITFCYRPTLPLTGIFFSQGYGELYYEIYLGNKKNLVHGAWPGNYFYIDNPVTADLRFGATSLRIGYHNTVLSTSVNHIVTRMATHSFVLGVSGEWIGFDSRRGMSTPTRIISAIY